MLAGSRGLPAGPRNLLTRRRHLLPGQCNALSRGRHRLPRSGHKLPRRSDLLPGLSDRAGRRLKVGPDVRLCDWLEEQAGDHRDGPYAGDPGECTHRGFFRSVGKMPGQRGEEAAGLIAIVGLNVPSRSAATLTKRTGP